MNLPSKEVLYQHDLEPIVRAARALVRETRRLALRKPNGNEDQMVKAAHQVHDELIEWMSMNRHPARVVKAKKARKAESQIARKAA